MTALWISQRHRTIDDHIVHHYYCTFNDAQHCFRYTIGDLENIYRFLHHMCHLGSHFCCSVYGLFSL